MALPLTQLFARFGTELSPNQRLDFVHQILSSNHPSSCEAWEFLWREKILTFDRRQVDDALHRFLESPAGDSIIRSALTPNPDGHLAFALVPGCGRGDDAIALASLGFNTWGVDISPTAIEYAIAGTSEQADSMGTVTFMAVDFFALDPPPSKFCLIYDTMFFCSLAPVLHDTWATTMCRLIRPGGYLVISISLTDPSHGGTSSEGPPYSVNLDMISEKLRGSGEVAPWSLVYTCTSDPIGNGVKQMITVWKKVSTELMKKAAVDTVICCKHSSVH